MDRLYTIPEFADMLRISRSKAYRIIKDESIVPLRLGPRSTRLTQEQVDSLIERWKTGID
jgi:excisionase family DNA binding protein